MIKPDQIWEAPCTQQTPSGTFGDVSLFVTSKMFFGQCSCRVEICRNWRYFLQKMTQNFMYFLSNLRTFSITSFTDSVNLGTYPENLLTYCARL